MYLLNCIISVHFQRQTSRKDQAGKVGNIPRNWSLANFKSKCWADEEEGGMVREKGAEESKEGEEEA